jgi:antitoxin component YwqK of YwqJK toxin-antitoxin module
MKSLLITLLLLTACTTRTTRDAGTLTSLQVIDRNGFSETISGKERLVQYKGIDYLAPQPYQKVLRVFSKNAKGKNLSKITSYHPNGQVWQYLEVSEGRAHGAYREWHPNGRIKLELTVIEGIADISEIAQASWVFDGGSFVWDEEGRLVADFVYEKGELQETAHYYHPDGSIHQELPYKNHALDGAFTVFDEKGEIVEKIFYEKGVKHGSAFGPHYTEEYDQGRLLSASYHLNGTFVAKISHGFGKQAIFEEGRLHSLLEYQNGIQEGLVEIFDPRGHLQNTFLIKDGKKEGEEWNYYASSKPKLCVFWQDDAIQGIVKTWYENGVMESQREISQNKKHGFSFAWYKGGEVMFMEEYDQNTLQKGTYFKKGDKHPVSKVEEGQGTATLYNGDGHFLQKITYDKGKPLLN